MASTNQSFSRSFSETVEQVCDTGLCKETLYLTEGFPGGQTAVYTNINSNTWNVVQSYSSGDFVPNSGFNFGVYNVLGSSPDLLSLQNIINPVFSNINVDIVNNTLSFDITIDPTQAIKNCRNDVYYNVDALEAFNPSPIGSKNFTFLKIEKVSKPIELIKHFENGEFKNVEYRDLEGNPYTVQGTIGLCTPEKEAPVANPLDSVKTSFQPKGCKGDDINTPIDVLKTTVENIVSVRDCNSDSILNALGQISANTLTSANSSAAITSSLNNILTQVTAVNANTDTIETKLQTLITDQLAGNVTLVQTKAVLDTLLPQLQAINANTDTVETLIANTNTKLDALIAVQDKELIVTASQAICVTNGTSKVTSFLRTKFIYDSKTATLLSEVTEYSANGVTGWSVTAPTGTILVGACSITALAYDINELALVNATTPTVTLPALTFHSVSIQVIRGTVTITIAGVSFIAPAPYSNTFSADTLLKNAIVITGGSGTNTAFISTMK